MSARPYLGGAKRVWSARETVVQAYKTNPRLANAVTGFATFSLGDVLAQKVEQKQSGVVRKLDLWRSTQLGFLGVVMNGFFLHHWFNLLDRVVGSSMKSKIGVAAKVAADQFIFAPFAIAVFFGYNTVRQSSSIDDAQVRWLNCMRQNFMPTFVADCSLWPAANFVNFRYVHLNYRPTFTAAVQLLWQTYMSATFSLGQQQPHTQPHPVPHQQAIGVTPIAMSSGGETVTLSVGNGSVGPALSVHCLDSVAAEGAPGSSGPQDGN
jgi:hypothetical protein